MKRIASFWAALTVASTLSGCIAPSDPIYYPAYDGNLSTDGYPRATKKDWGDEFNTNSSESQRIRDIQDFREKRRRDRGD